VEKGKKGGKGGSKWELKPDFNSRMMMTVRVNNVFYMIGCSC